MMERIAIFDGHNDVLTRLNALEAKDTVSVFVNGPDGAVTQVKAKAGGFAGGFFAIWVPSRGEFGATRAQMQAPRYDIPLPPPVPMDEARRVVAEQSAILFELERAGALKVCHTVAELRAAMASDTLAAIYHIEGAEAIAPDLGNLDQLYADGLRSLGPTWSRPTAFGHGVPFRFPSTPDIGPGLTEAGKALIQRCDALGIMVDLSHLNEAGFWDVAHLSSRPLVATHSNAHAICPHARNLTDAQLDAIRTSDGLVGLNFAVSFLRPDGGKFADTPLDIMIRHLDYLLGRLGEDRVGLGSDFDGAVVPDRVKTTADLPVLVSAMRQAGYGEALIRKICCDNWMRVLELSWQDRGSAGTPT